MINTVEELEAVLNNAHDRCIIALNGALDTKSKTLYHYTNLSACLSILNQSKIRFTDIRYCNDPDEIDSGLKILNKVHEELSAEYLDRLPLFYKVMSFVVSSINLSASFSNDEAELTKKVASSLIDLGLDPSEYPFTKSPIYIACFSEKNDDLRQWIPYADNGKGVAIGFKGLDTTHDITFDNIWIIKVCYKSAVEKEIYVKNVYKELFDIFQNTSPSLIGHLAGFIQVNFLNDIIACKSESYKDEEEWRLFFVDLKDSKEKLNYYVHDNILKPFIDVAINKDAILEIVLGPKSENVLNRHALLKVFSKFNYKNAQVDLSKVAYR